MASQSFIDIGVLDALKESLLGICVVFLMLAILIIVISIMGKLKLGQKKQSEPAKTVTAPCEDRDTVVLENVDDKTAAMIMAIVADETGIPVNELNFKSIKEIK